MRSCLQFLFAGRGWAARMSLEGGPDRASVLCDGVSRCVYSRPLWRLVAGEEVGRLKAMCAHQEYLDGAQPHQILSQWCRVSLSRKTVHFCRSPGVSRRVPSRVPNTADCGDGAHQEYRAPRGGPSMPLPPRSAVLARACPTATPRSQTVVSCAQCTRRGTLSCCRYCVALTLALLVQVRQLVPKCTA